MVTAATAAVTNSSLRHWSSRETVASVRIMSDARTFREWMQFTAGVSLASLLFAGASSAATTWSLHTMGTLGVQQNCSKVGARLSALVCGFHVANAPSSNARESLHVVFANTTSRAACFGVSVSTSQMAGLRSVCVKARDLGNIVMSGPGREYRATQLSLFVTSGSAKKPIAPVRVNATYPFSILVSQTSP